jgi:NAD(P)-dependent dehydrogenase (short-subunit alcohol dehydrogenase family)
VAANTSRWRWLKTVGRLLGRVAIVTGAGRGLGRAHALQLASEGAAVIVNDLGGDVHGQGADDSPAEQVSAEIRQQGGQAVASSHDVSDWDQAAQLVALAEHSFGHLDVLVNNAGILRDRTLANMSADEWDAVIRVHLRGHAAATRHAMAYWRDRARAGQTVHASVINTTSVAAFTGNFGQANYSAAKAAIIGLSRVVALEGARYGVRSNAVSPSARTRISAAIPSDVGAPHARSLDANGFDRLDPANVSPLIAWLAAEDCPANSQVFQLIGERLIVSSMSPIVHDLRTSGRWTLEALDRALPSRLVQPLEIEDFLG